MSAASPGPRSANVPDSFADGILAHYESFLQTAGLSGTVFVRITLVNGDQYTFQGLRGTHLANVPGCVMFHGRDGGVEDALVVREAHLLKADFRIKPFEEESQRGVFGFQPLASP